MPAKPAPSRAERYAQLCREGAKLLGAKVSDDRCEHYATMRLARETLTAKLVGGLDIDPSVLLRIDESLRAFMPPPAQRHRTVTIKFCSCRKCGDDFPTSLPGLPPSSNTGSSAPDKAVPTPDAKPEAAAKSSPEPSAR
jgi:hypothetical protein